MLGCTAESRVPSGTRGSSGGGFGSYSGMIVLCNSRLVLLQSGSRSVDIRFAGRVRLNVLSKTESTSTSPPLSPPLFR